MRDANCVSPIGPMKQQLPRSCISASPGEKYQAKHAPYLSKMGLFKNDFACCFFLVFEQSVIT